MTELLSLPGWQAPPRTLDDWAGQLAALGHPPAVVRESGSVAWLEVAALRVRGYAVIEGPHVTAINFELSDPDPGPASRLVQAAAAALGWEVHEDEDEEESD